jgi:hypothetical protein
VAPRTCGLVELPEFRAPHNLGVLARRTHPTNRTPRREELHIAVEQLVDEPELPDIDKVHQELAVVHEVERHFLADPSFWFAFARQIVLPLPNSLPGEVLWRLHREQRH